VVQVKVSREIFRNALHHITNKKNSTDFPGIPDKNSHFSRKSHFCEFSRFSCPKYQLFNPNMQHKCYGKIKCTGKWNNKRSDTAYGYWTTSKLISHNLTVPSRYLVSVKSAKFYDCSRFFTTPMKFVFFRISGTVATPGGWAEVRWELDDPETANYVPHVILSFELNIDGIVQNLRTTKYVLKFNRTGTAS